MCNATWHPRYDFADYESMCKLLSLECVCRRSYETHLQRQYRRDDVGYLLDHIRYCHSLQPWCLGPIRLLHRQERNPRLPRRSQPWRRLRKYVFSTLRAESGPYTRARKSVARRGEPRHVGQGRGLKSSRRDAKRWRWRYGDKGSSSLSYYRRGQRNSRRAFADSGSRGWLAAALTDAACALSHRLDHASG